MANGDKEEEEKVPGKNAPGKVPFDKERSEILKRTQQIRLAQRPPVPGSPPPASEQVVFGADTALPRLPDESEITPVTALPDASEITTVSGIPVPTSVPSEVVTKPDRFADVREMDRGNLRRQDFASVDLFAQAIRDRNASANATGDRRAAAAQRVMDSRAGLGGGLSGLTTMQDANYELGSGSVLRRSPRELESESGRMARLGRGLVRQGLAKEGRAMIAQGAAAKLNEPNIRSEAEIRRQETDRRDLLNQISALRNQQQQYQDFFNTMQAGGGFDRSRYELGTAPGTGGLMTGGLRTSGLQLQSNITKAGSDGSRIRQSTRNTQGSRLT